MNNKPERLVLKRGELELPAFFPDGTYGAVRCVGADDLSECGVPGVVMNGLHLMSKPGAGVIRAFGGLNAFAGLDMPILTDSGGFQVFSLIRQNPKYGEIRKNELIFRPDGGADKLMLTPEKSVQFQFACGSDMIMCLDCCSGADDSYEDSASAAEITAEWAKRCKKEYETQLRARKTPENERPLIFAIIQGGGYRDLRKACADELIKTGFDGYGFGGWPVGPNGALDSDILEYTAGLMPDGSVKYAMGVGKPDEIVSCVKMGYGLFDCVIPTREARRNRLYVFNGGAGDSFAYGHYYILDEKHSRETGPVSDECDCPACRKYSRAYIYHLYKTGESLGFRLATMHNLRFYTSLMEKLRGKNIL